MIKKIYGLLSEQQQRRSVGVMLAVLLRAVLDFAGVAALVPILLVVMKQDGRRETMLALCGAVLLFVMLKNGLVMLLARVQSRFQLDIYREFSQRMFVNYYQRGLLFLKGKSSTQLGHEVNYVCYMFCLSVLAPFFRMVSEIVLALLMVTALVIWEPIAGLLLCAVLLPLTGLYIGVVRKRLRRYGVEELEARRKQSRIVVEAFRGYTELEIAQAFHASLHSFDRGMDLIVHNRLRMEICQLFPSFLSEAAMVCGLALLIGVGQGNLAVVSGVFAVAAFRLIPAVKGILNSWGTLQNASHTIEVVSDGIADPARLKSETEPSFTFRQGIELQGVSFAFPDGHTLFQDLNLRISRGERIGVRGASGAGKSTLFNLLLGFLEPTKGNICIDGKRLAATNREDWHKRVGYVPQEIFIIDGTIADNIALGKSQADRAKVAHVLEQVQLKEWADQLPQGIDTPLCECGSRLSGGQKQRIGIARALYKEAEVLFFDEATSALDNHTEKEINHALEILSHQDRELTLIIIAHRESSLAFCDRIFDMNTMKLIDNH